MRIALLSCKRRCELMARFCVAYRGILSAHELCAPSDVARVVSGAAKLNVLEYLNSDFGGIQQIESRISCGEIDLVFFFRDVLVSFLDTPENDVLRICDFHSIPIATNIAIAEVLIHGLERGDLDWREIGVPAI
ncbi:MAG: methylglyoxal synthase [Candidatus Improbicoccus devescovinae]|nr:MAG: methylglyoxal synthase [Candidatus Improbicoccus devescovinae]